MIYIYIAIYVAVLLPAELIMDCVKEVLNLNDAAALITGALIALLITENIYKGIF